MTFYRCLILVLVLAIIGLQSRLWHGDGSLAHINTLEDEVAQRVAEKESREQRNAILKAEVRALKQGFDAAEEIARSELGLIKKGETFYLLIEDSGQGGDLQPVEE